MKMDVPKCVECGQPLTCICMACRGRARSKRKLNATRANMVKARKAKKESLAQYHRWFVEQAAADRLSYMDWLARYREPEP